MAKTSTNSRKTSGNCSAHASARRDIPGQVVLVLQGGGALGAYQVGCYEALHEAGIEPDRVIGTSIGAINAALIAGNARETGWRGCTTSGRASSRDRSTTRSCSGPGSPIFRPIWPP